MPIIDETNGVLNETSTEYYQNTLNNSRILLYELDRAILALTRGGHHAYSLNTGQSVQSVTRENLNELIKTRDELLYTISMLEDRLNIRHGIIHATPGW